MDYAEAVKFLLTVKAIRKLAPLFNKHNIEVTED